jgi:hypothetical protein
MLSYPILPIQKHIILTPSCMYAQKRAYRPQRRPRTTNPQVAIRRVILVHVVAAFQIAYPKRKRSCAKCTQRLAASKVSIRHTLQNTAGCSARYESAHSSVASVCSTVSSPDSMRSTRSTNSCIQISILSSKSERSFSTYLQRPRRLKRQRRNPLPACPNIHAHQRHSTLI